MRFAIALLCLIAIASIIGTILPQNEPQAVYINQFGLFWATLFDYLGLYTLYSSLWFLLILVFLVLSTSICLIRNIPKIWADLQDWKLTIQLGSLRALPYHQAYISPLPRAIVTEKVTRLLAQQHYRFRVQQQTQHTLISARTGRANKLGYIATHAAVIIICIGALFDSDIWLKMQLLSGQKKVLVDQAQSLLLHDIPPEHRLASTMPSFQANLFLPEGQSSHAALINVRDGTLVQELPFTLTLKQFKVDYYPTGMPKLFASDVVLTDLENGQTITRTIKVNHPLIYKGIAIYQSSFADGGSLLELAGYPMRDTEYLPFSVNAEIGQQSEINSGQDSYSLELSDFRTINVENITDQTRQHNSQALTPLTDKIGAYFGSGAKNISDTVLRNIGPSIQYKLRDRAGQAKEFNTYMLPVAIDGIRVFLIGMRDMANEPFRYLRIPADEQGGLNEWMAFRAALQNRPMRIKAAARYAQSYLQQNKIQANANPRATQSHQPIQQVQQIALHLLDQFGATPQPQSAQTKLGGFAAIAKLIEETVPENAQARTAEIFMQILQGSLYELWQLTRAQIDLPAATRSPEDMAFLYSAINALSDSFFYSAPVLMHLRQFTEIKGSVFQVRRMPGKKIVYAGCLLLVLGIVMMFYIEAHRVWIVIQDQKSDGCHILFAATSHRQTIHFAQIFSDLKTTLQTVTQAVSTP